MTDAELTAFAAKAFGDVPTGFSPLTDDGDALRLAVKLGLTINLHKAAVCVSRNEDEPVTLKAFGADRSADTRRAITLAAAEIGRSA